MASPPVSNAAHSDDWRKTVAPSGMCKACQSTKVTTRCRLLSLPPELRRCIWEMVLDGESCDIEPNYEDQPVFAELMDVCMQIRQEAMVFVLRSTRLRIEVYVHGTAKRQFERFLNSLNVECRRALSANTDAKLVLYIGNCEVEGHGSWDAWGSWEHADQCESILPFLDLIAAEEQKGNGWCNKSWSVDGGVGCPQAVRNVIETFDASPVHTKFLGAIDRRMKFLTWPRY